MSILVTGWSLNMPWGDELAVGKGPPNQWERYIVGACLLLFIGAVAFFRSVDKRGIPKKLALVVAGTGCAIAIMLAMKIRGTSIDNGQTHILLGGGWMWMFAGCSMSSGAVVSAIILHFTPDKYRVPAASADKGSAQANTTKPKQNNHSNKRKNKNKKKR